MFSVVLVLVFWWSPAGGSGSSVGPKGVSHDGRWPRWMGRCFERLESLESCETVVIFDWLHGCVWKCCVPHCTQWFCWSLSLLNGYNWEYTLFSDKPTWWSVFVAGAVLQMAQALSSWQVLQGPRRKSARNVKTSYITCLLFVARADSNMCSCNPLVTSCVSDHSRCGEILSRRSCTAILPGDLFKILCKDLLYIEKSCAEIFYRRSCQEINFTETLCRDLARGPF